MKMGLLQRKFPSFRATGSLEKSVQFPMDPLRSLLSILAGTWQCDCSVPCWELFLACDQMSEQWLRGSLALCLPYPAARQNTESKRDLFPTTNGILWLCITLYSPEAPENVLKNKTNLTQVCIQSVNRVIASENKQELNSLAGFLSWLNLS